jgi:type VI secretion system protein VasG
MSKIRRDVIFRRLNAIAYKAIDDAFAGCEQRGNEYVELAHWIYELLQLQDSDVHHILRHFDIDTATVVTDLVRLIEKTPRRVLRILNSLSTLNGRSRKAGFMQA